MNIFFSCFFFLSEADLKIVHLCHFLCRVCAEEDFPNTAGESADRNSAQGRDFITASASELVAMEVCSFAKRSNLCLPSAWSSDYGNYYQCLWDCAADETDELDFQRGDLIYIISKV